MKLTRWIIPAVVAAFFAFAVPGFAQSSRGSGDESRGWTFYESFQGSSSSLGQVTRLDSTAGFNFNKYFAVDAGFPVYFIRTSSSTNGTQSTNGLGDVYAQLRLTLRNPIVNYASVLTGTAPTGDSNRGLSSGRATFDWTNHFDRSFGRLTPYAGLGIANTVTDTQFFVRPFTSFGTVAHFDAGAKLRLAHFVALDVSVYDVAPTGQQKIFSRFVPRQVSNLGGPGIGGHGRVFQLAGETIGSAELARDNGFSAGLDLYPVRYVDALIGYTHSVHFGLDILYFGVGVNVGALVRHAHGQ
jgi:hypothetical protein